MKTLVIGAGIIGVLSARVLQRRGHQVILVDRQAPGEECSFGNAGYLAVEEIAPMANFRTLLHVPKMLLNPRAPLTIRWQDFPGLLPWFLRFKLACLPRQFERGSAAIAWLCGNSQAAWDEELELAGLGALLARKGFLHIHETAGALSDHERACKLQTRHDIRFDTLDRQQVLDLLPGLTANVHAGTWHPDGCHVLDPSRLVKDMAAAFIADGGEFVRIEVIGLGVRDGGGLIAQGADTQIEADKLVLATGLQSKGLARMLGISAPLVAERGYHVMVEHAPPERSFAWGSTDRGFIMTPMAAGLRLAGTVEFASEHAPESWARADNLLRNYRAMFADAPVRELSRWMGRRPTLPDYLPAIGASRRQPDLICAYGHQHLGLTMAAISGRLVADAIEGKAYPAELAAIRPDRFR